jgi:hypothetical protein
MTTTMMMMMMMIMWSQDISVGIAIGYGLNDQGSILRKGKRCF